MDAREFWKIVKTECNSNGCDEKCSFYEKNGVGHICACSKYYIGDIDPVAIAEQIKAEQMPKPATEFEPGKKYQFSAQLYDGSMKEWANGLDGNEVIATKQYGELTGGIMNVPPCWCYEVEDKPELPELPKKQIIIYKSNWSKDLVDALSKLSDNQNAIIDYLKARENND